MGDKDQRGSAGRHGDLFWTEEKDNFGLKMMGKMGWSQGTGLGKQSQGATQFVKATKKKDNTGIGAVNGRDDTWFAARDLYNDVLKRLAESHTNPDGSTDAGPDLSSDNSSISTGAQIANYMAQRQLYGKFRKSKNLGLYGEKALSEIMGRKPGEEPAKAAAKTGSAAAGGKEVKTAAEITSELQTTTSSVSMRDYFARALQSSDKKVNKFQVAAGTGFGSAFQENYYDSMMGMAIKGKKGLGAGGAGANNRSNEDERPFRPQNAKPAPAPAAAAKPAAGSDDEAPYRPSFGGSANGQSGAAAMSFVAAAASANGNGTHTAPAPAADSEADAAAAKKAKKAAKKAKKEAAAAAAATAEADSAAAAATTDTASAAAAAADAPETAEERKKRKAEKKLRKAAAAAAAAAATPAPAEPEPEAEQPKKKKRKAESEAAAAPAEATAAAEPVSEKKKSKKSKK